MAKGLYQAGKGGGGGLGFILRALGSCSESKQKGGRRMSSSHRLLVEELAEV